MPIADTRRRSQDPSRPEIPAAADGFDARCLGKDAGRSKRGAAEAWDAAWDDDDFAEFDLNADSEASDSDDEYCQCFDDGVPPPPLAAKTPLHQPAQPASRLSRHPLIQVSPTADTVAQELLQTADGYVCCRVRHCELVSNGCQCRRYQLQKCRRLPLQPPPQAVEFAGWTEELSF